MRITCCKQNGAQLHPRESATLPTAEPLAVMLQATVKTDRNYFDDFFKSFNPQSDILSIIGNKV